MSSWYDRRSDHGLIQIGILHPAEHFHKNVFRTICSPNWQCINEFAKVQKLNVQSHLKEPIKIFNKVEYLKR